MEKLNIIFDFDDTLFITTPYLVSYINERWDIDSKESDYVDFSKLEKIVELYKNDSSITHEMIYKDYRSNFMMSYEWHKKVLPMPYMQDIVERLSRKYRLHIATKRSNQGAGVVNMLIDKYIPDCIDSIYYATKYSEFQGYLYQTKRDFIIGLDGKSIAFIDDSKHEVEDTKDIINTFLFDPKDKHNSVDGVQRIRSFLEIGELFL